MENNQLTWTLKGFALPRSINYLEISSWTVGRPLEPQLAPLMLLPWSLCLIDTTCSPSGQFL
jgi:hypothetical protein